MKVNDSWIEIMLLILVFTEPFVVKYALTNGCPTVSVAIEEQPENAYRETI